MVLVPFASFHSRFPELAERETRTMTILRGGDGLPTGSYGFVELFCDEPGCDCRRVLLQVFGERQRRLLATVNFGWEDRSFYRNWLHGQCSPEELAELKGPALLTGAPQSELAPALLHEASAAVLSDPDYVARLKRHYALFREAIDRESAPVRRGPAPGRNDPCPCGSGRKFKKCCGSPTAIVAEPREGVSTSARVVTPTGHDLRDDIAYVVERAVERDVRIVQMHGLVLFSGSNGDAWMLDPSDRLATPLARAGKALAFEVVESRQRFSLSWTHDYELDGERFVTVDRATGEKRVESGYPVAHLRGAGIT